MLVLHRYTSANNLTDESLNALIGNLTEVCDRRRKLRRVFECSIRVDAWRANTALHRRRVPMVIVGDDIATRQFVPQLYRSFDWHSLPFLSVRPVSRFRVY